MARLGALSTDRSWRLAAIMQVSVEVATVASRWLKSLNEWSRVCTLAIRHLNRSFCKQPVHLLFLIQVYHQRAVFLVDRHCPEPSHLVHFHPVHPLKHGASDTIRRNPTMGSINP